MKKLRLAGGVLLALTVIFASAASADRGHRDYQWLAGSGFLCDLDPAACPDIARAPNGDTIEIRGEGTFAIHPKSASGGGTFVHKSANGDVIGQGTFTATNLISFHSYGSGAEQGLPEELEGGKALLEVHLTPEGGGPGFDGILRITCLLGDKIPASAEEGVRLLVKGGPNFNKEVSGLTIFIRE